MFDTSQNYILEDERVLLRPLEVTDFTNLLSFSENEPLLWKYALITGASPDNLRLYIESAIQKRISKTQYSFVVFDKKTNQYAGCTRFYEINNDTQSALLGYTWYGQDFQGTGLNKHCKALMLKFVFETCGFERIEFRADAANQQSIRALLKIGCKQEGVLRSHIPRLSGGRRDTAVLSILKDEWFDQVKILLS